MPAIHRTAAARGDYLEIFLHIGQHNVPVAERLVQEFDRTLITFSENPGMGQERPEFGSGIRSFPVRSYLLFYRPTTDGIELLRALHGARNLPPLFGRR